MRETLSLFFAMMAVGGALFVIATLLGALVSKLGLPGSKLASTVAAEIRPFAHVFAFVAAATAMAGSLYYSEIAGLTPCRMCWYQRFCMYPAALLLGLNLIRRHRALPLAAWGLSAVGVCISTYHRLEQAFPEDVGGSCDPAVPCTDKLVEQFGFITIPTMAGVAFALVLVLIPLSRSRSSLDSSSLDSQSLDS